MINLAEIISDIDNTYASFIDQYQTLLTYQKEYSDIDIDFSSEEPAKEQKKTYNQKQQDLIFAERQLDQLRKHLFTYINEHIYFNFPGDQLWRLGIDQQYQETEAKNNPFYFDEPRYVSDGFKYLSISEPGYRWGMEKAFVLMERTLHLPLSVELIVALHDMAISTLIVEDDDSTIVGIRNSGNGFGLGKLNSTYEGISEILCKYQDFVCIVNPDTKQISCNPDEICNGKKFGKIDKINMNAEKISSILKDLIEKYNNDIQQSKTPLQKIKAIAEFIHKCDLLHPFQDANVRTFVFLLCNRLLFENGLPLALFEDPNRFDGYSVKQLCLEIVKGMEHALKFSGIQFNLEELKFVIEKEIMIESKIYEFERKIRKVANEVSGIASTPILIEHVTKYVPHAMARQWEIINAAMNGVKSFEEALNEIQSSTNSTQNSFIFFGSNNDKKTSKVETHSELRLGV